MSGITDVVVLQRDFDSNTSLDPDDLWSIDNLFSGGIRALQCFLLVIGILLAWLGNGAAMYAVYHTRRHDPVLGTFILNLIVNDLLLSLFDLPLILLTLTLGRWSLGDAACNLTACLSTMLKLALPWSVCCLAIDKYCAVVHAMYYRNLLTSFRCYLMVSTIWICAGCLAILPLVGFGDYRFILSTFRCGVAWNANYYYATLSCVVGILAPMIITIYCYACVLRTSLSHGRRVDAPVQLSRVSRVMRTRGRPRDHRAGSALSSHHAPLSQFEGRIPRVARRDDVSQNGYNPKKAIRHVLGICGAFLCCWIPYTTIQVYLVVNQSINGISYYHSNLTLAVYLLCINVVLNPYMYIFFNHRIKRTLKKSIRKLCRKERPQRRSTVFVTNYSRVGHRAAMRHHRARYAGLAPIYDQYQRGLQVRGSDSTSSILSEAHLLHVEEIRPRHGEDRTMIGLDRFPNFAVDHRRSSAVSDLSAATFPDMCVPGAAPSDNESDQASSSFTAREDSPTQKPADNSQIEQYQTRKIPTSRHGRIDIDDDVFQDPAIAHEDRKESILVPHSFPLQRKVRKKVLFSDSGCYKEKQKAREVKSLPAMFLSSSSSNSEDGYDDGLSKTMPRSHSVHRQRWQRAKTLVTEEPRRTRYKSARDDRFHKHSNTTSNDSYSTTRESHSKRTSHSKKCRKEFSKDRKQSYYDNQTHLSNTFTYDKSSRRNEAANGTHGIHTQFTYDSSRRDNPANTSHGDHTPYYYQLSPTEFTSRRYRRDEKHFADETSERSSFRNNKKRLSHKDLPEALTLNPMNLSKIALSPIIPKHHTSYKCDALSYDNLESVLMKRNRQAPDFAEVDLEETRATTTKSHLHDRRKTQLQSRQEPLPTIRITRQMSQNSEPRSPVLAALSHFYRSKSVKDDYDESVL